MTQPLDVLREISRDALRDPRRLSDEEVELFRRILDGDATKDDYVTVLERSHGDIEDGKAALFLIADEEDFDVEAEDVEVITRAPPTGTFL